MKSTILFMTLLMTQFSWAIKLSDYTPYKAESIFTNPVCETYAYRTHVTSQAGDQLTQKPQNVYCKAQDENASIYRKNSVFSKLSNWIKDSNYKHLKLAYLSFRSKPVWDALCKAASNGKKIEMVLDYGTDLKNPKINADAEKLKECGDVSVYYRGSGKGLGFAHNKMLIAQDPKTQSARIIFSSGNLTTGTSTNHENWNFITTSSRSYFYQTHVCAYQGMLQAGDSKQNFNNFLNDCRSNIKAKEEDDIKTFFIPTDAHKTTKMLEREGQRSNEISGMSHRFSGVMLKWATNLVEQDKSVRFIFDDDIYWSSKLRKDIGRNTRQEAFAIQGLIKAGLSVKYLETNQDQFQLQHNKFLIFDERAVFTGAGNFTTSAMTKNYENFYLITIPEMVKAYLDQYDAYWFDMASSYEEMPKQYVMP